MRRFDKFLALEAEGLAADDTGDVQPRHHADGDENQDQVAAEESNQQDHEKHKREGTENFQPAHHQGIDLAAQIAGYRAIHGADHHRHQRAGQADHQRNAPADGHTHQKVAAEGVGAQIVFGFYRRGNLHIAPVGIGVIKGRKQRHENHEQGNQPNDKHAGQRGLVAFETAPGVLPQAAAFDFGFRRHLLNSFGLFLAQHSKMVP